MPQGSKYEPIPRDILERLRNDYRNEKDYAEALNIVEQVKVDILNVGWDQLIRSMLLIADGNLETMKQIIESKYYGDPRDVIMKMMSMPEVANNYGMTPFETKTTHNKT